MGKFLLYLSVLLISFNGVAQTKATVNAPGKKATVTVNAPGKSSNVNIVSADPAPPVIAINNFTFAGESNTGSEAPNSSATPTELAPRAETFILNNNTLLFENLDVGTNNLIGHINMTSPTTRHAWELQMANLAASGDLKNPTNIIKCGQGGSTIAMWGIGGTIPGTIGCPGDNNPCNASPRTIYRQRVNAAMAILNPTGVKYALFWSQGINDMLAGTNVATWKTATKAVFADIRAQDGMLPIVFFKIMVNSSTTAINVAAYNTAIDEICSEIQWCYPVEVTGAGLQNDYHFNYAGQKQNANNGVSTLKAHGFSLN